MSIPIQAPTLDRSADRPSKSGSSGEARAAPVDDVSAEHGELRGFTPTGIAQLIEVEGKTCILRMRHGENRGDLVFRRGRLVDARTASDSGENAALAILGWQIADVRVVEAPVGDSAMIDRPLSDLILEAARLYDETVRNALDDTDLGGWLDEDSQHLVTGPDDLDDLPEIVAARLDGAIAKLLSLDGARRVALVDFERGRVVRAATQGECDGRMDTEYDFHLPCGFGVEGGVEDVLTTLEDRYHLVRPLCSCRRLLLHLTLDRAQSNLALARHCLAKVEIRLCVD